MTEHGRAEVFLGLIGHLFREIQSCVVHRQRNFNPALAIDGVLLTMYDARLKLSKQVADEAKEYFGSQMFGITIPRNVRLAEAPSFGKPILLYDVQSVGAKSYLAVAQELIRRVEHGAVNSPPPAPPAAEPLPEVPA